MNERAERVARRFEIPVMIAAVLVIPVMAIEQSDVGERWRTLAGVTNWIIWIVFALELVVMLAVVDDRRRWLARHPLEVAIVVLTPPFLPASLQAARALRLLRLLRLVRLAPIARRFFSLDGLRYAALLALLTALGGGAAFAAAEGKELSTWDGVWWAVTTMTTVGYGDIYPETTLGRIVAVSVMLVGIGFVAILTAALAQKFVERQLAATEAEIAAEVEEAEADVVDELREVGERLRRLEARLSRGS